MKDSLAPLYSKHALIFKVFLFLLTTVLVVYVFPKSGSFKYSFEKGKPWQSENLYAPFDFAIKKSAEDIASEKDLIALNAPLFFRIDTAVASSVKAHFDSRFFKVIPDSISDASSEQLYRSVRKIVSEIYEKGFSAENESIDKEKSVITLINQTQQEKLFYADFITPSKLRNYLDKQLAVLEIKSFENILISLFYDVLLPNATLDKQLSATHLQDKLSSIVKVRGGIEKETLIISKGEVVEGLKLDILKSLESEYQSQVLTRSNYYWVVSAYTLLVALALLMLLLFLRKYRLEVFNNNTKVTFIFFNIALMVILTTLTVNFNASYIYVVPLCILPLILKAFFDARLGLFAHVITVLLLGFVVPNNYEYMFLQIIAGIVTILTVSELYKRANLFISVGQITMIYLVSYFAFHIIHEGNIDTIEWETFLLFLLGGLATLFVQPLIYIYEKLFGLVSDVSLLELSDTNSKLLKKLSNEAPGTFHHSLNVANLAEAAANEIGANAMLSRVGALYHDIGKMNNPTYFTENQSTATNPHNQLSAQESATVIINHVINGIEIAKKFNLPDRVVDFIRTHHGTNTVYYFYNKQRELDEQTKESDFKYNGPTPFSKETAIVMMCDSVEAASKSLKEPTSTKINTFVESIISKQVEAKQFLNANITFKEIESIKKVLKFKLANMYHLRIEYPE